MKVSTLAWKTVAAVAAGVIAGAVVLRIRATTSARRAAEGEVRFAVPRATARTLPSATARALPRATARALPSATARTEPAQPAEPAQPDALEKLTKRQLYQEACKQNIRGRSKMTKAELRRALR